MKNPLRKRLLRELRSEIGKYMVIFLLLVGTIGFVSGFLVADGSMLRAYNEGFEKYNIEDGNFRLAGKANKALKKMIQSFGVTLYDNFYVEEELVNGSTLRIFKNREEVNRVCLMEGALPGNAGEIAIDRMYADNNEIRVGDILESENQSWTVTGLVALSDYSCLFSNNNDSMFDSVKFGVSVVTGEEFERFAEEDLNYSYSWKYEKPPLDEAEEKQMSEDLMKQISGEASLEAFIPCYLNQAIQFTGDDMGSDRAMIAALLYIVIVIMAFVFGITISNTINKEANVIGTLRASGYTQGELIRHYMAMPLLVTAAGAVAGNILGYTVFKDVCVSMYYGSYSLPTYKTIWNGEAFLMTTVIPVLLMIIINFVILKYKMTLSPLKFLRRDLSRRKQKRALRLSTKIGFFRRFRLRIIFQNLSNYVILFVGVLFANLLLMFGLLFPAVLDHYQEEMENNLLCNYQYILQVPLDAVDEEHKLESLLSMMQFARNVETENKEAEKFSAYSLNTLDGTYKSESIMLYGIKNDSSYVQADVSGEQVYISSAYSEKYGVAPGDRIQLKEAYEDRVYEFTVTDIYDYEGALAVFMGQTALNETFGMDKDYFSGYFSNTEITDIDSRYIGSVIDLEALTKISRQLDVSMGSMMLLVDGFAIVIFMVLIYLLSKIIIEKNAQSISMVKILGYSDGEISRLYIISTTVVVIVFLLISLPIEYRVMEFLFRVIMMSSISGWIPLYVDSMIYVKMFLIGIGTYLVVALLEYRKIRRVAMDEALKNVE
ncbi:FtsX-like permease family protein [Frisingicoccus sp.]|uniref:ABC transporter permease n=1 Tax=Frisingicoccus sp. TaxID=1918627 RepID=UPI003AB4A953